MSRVLLLALTVLAMYCASGQAARYKITLGPKNVDTVDINTKTQKIHISNAGQSYITNLKTPLMLRRYAVIKDVQTRQCLMTVIDDDAEERTMHHQQQKFLALSKTAAASMYERKRCYNVQQTPLSRYQQTMVAPIYKQDCSSIKFAFNRYHGYGSSEEYLYARNEEPQEVGDLEERNVGGCDGLCVYSTCSRNVVVGVGRRCCRWNNTGYGCAQWCNHRYHYRPCFHKYRKVNMCQGK